MSCLGSQQKLLLQETSESYECHIKYSKILGSGFSGGFFFFKEKAQNTIHYSILVALSVKTF